MRIYTSLKINMGIYSGLLPSAHLVRGQYVMAPRNDQHWMYRAIVHTVRKTDGYYFPSISPASVHNS